MASETHFASRLDRDTGELYLADVGQERHRGNLSFPLVAIMDGTAARVVSASIQMVKNRDLYPSLTPQWKV